MLQIPNVHAKRLLDLADFIENLDPERFSMKQWGQHSEPRCICGWLLHNESHERKDDWMHAAQHLGLDEQTGSKLFNPDSDWDTHQAAQELRRLAVIA